MFEGLTQKFSGVIRDLKGMGHLTEENTQRILREVRLALLEADVQVQVVKSLLQGIQQKLVGEQVSASLHPDQHFMKALHEELVTLLGGGAKELSLTGKVPHSVFLVGLQGCGKTTTAVKLAHYWHKRGRRPYLIPADISRPAAIEQLTYLARQQHFPCYPTDAKQDPIKTMKKGIDGAKQAGCDVVIIDTAGRLHIDQSLIGDLQKWKKKLEPEHTLLVADAMTGQEAVRVAQAFKEAIDIDGLILTKLDGDARGGAALSMRTVTGCPIYFIGVGEKVGDLEPFHPERLVSRLLDRGDLISMVERAQEVLDLDAAKAQMKKIAQQKFDLQDYLFQLGQMGKLGSLQNIMGMIPGGRKLTGGLDMGRLEQDLVKKRAIIQSMTPLERAKPEILNGSRRLRVASGSGTAVSDINRLLKEFTQMRKIFKQFKGGGLGLLKGLMR